MSSNVRSLEVSRYRCFSKPFRLPLRPLTLVYGWNNAGKSALLQLFGILRDSAEGLGSSALDLARAGRDSSARDLRWKGARDTDPPGFELELEWAGARSVSTRFTIDYNRETHRLYVRRLTASAEHDRIQLENVALEPDRYDVLFGTNPVVPAKVRFRGLTPEFLEEGQLNGPAMKHLLGVLESRIVSLTQGVQWLASVRSPPPRKWAVDLPAATPLGSDGSGSGMVLAENPAVLSRVRSWYASKQIDRNLRLSEDAEHYRLTLSPSADPSLDIPLSDNGAGMASVLPVLTAIARALDRTKNNPETNLVAIEEPESHLHVNAQHALGDWMSDAVASDPCPTLVLETHSRALMLSVQLAIAEGRLPTDRVLVCWLSQRRDGATEPLLVEFDALGRPNTGALGEAFADERRLEAALTERQLARTLEETSTQTSR